MLEVTALMLCKLGGKVGTEGEIKAVLEAAGVTEINDEQISLLINDAHLGQKDIDTLLKEGMEKLKDVPMGGGGGGGGGAGGGAAGGGGGAAEEAKEEEEEEEADIGGGMDMFGGDGGDGDY